MSSPILRYFEYTHLPEPLKVISEKIYQVAWALENMIPDGAEKSAGLRKLLEAKDCFVRAALPADPAYPLIQPPAGTDFVREQMSKEAIASVKLDGETSALDQGHPTDDPNSWWLSSQDPVADKVFPMVKKVPLTDISVAYDKVQPPRETYRHLSEEVNGGIKDEVATHDQSKSVRENYKHTHLIKGRCYGPISVVDGRPGLKRGTCYFAMCEWNSEDFGARTMTLKELQNIHDSSESALIP